MEIGSQVISLSEAEITVDERSEETVSSTRGRTYGIPREGGSLLALLDQVESKALDLIERDLGKRDIGMFLFPEGSDYRVDAEHALDSLTGSDLGAKRHD